jgi:hypothetical protein
MAEIGIPIHVNGHGVGLGLADRMLRSVIPIVAVVAGACALYYGISGKIDRLADEVAAIKVEMAQSKQEMVSREALRTFCLEAQVLNRDWRCPFANEVAPRTVRTVPLRAVAGKPGAATQ